MLPPDAKLTLTQDNDSVTASGSGLSGWAYLTSSSNPDCDGDATYGSTGSTASSISDGHWVCFKAKDSSNVWSYAELQVDLTQPSLTLSQANDKIKATGTNLSGYEYFSQSGNPDCDKDDTFTGSGQTTGTITHNYWVCFKAKNGLGVYGYAELRINRTKPSFTLIQEGAKVKIADKTNLRSFAYFVSNSDPSDCSDSKTTGWVSSSTGITQTNMTNGRYVCFKAANGLGVFGYAKLQVELAEPELQITLSTPIPPELKTPVLEISQNGNSVSLSGQDLINVYHFISETEPVCDETNTTALWQEGLAIQDLSDGTWVCFKAQSLSGLWTYVKHRVNLQPPVVSLTQTQLAVLATATMAGEPSINLISWQHFKTADSLTPACDSDDGGLFGAEGYDQRSASLQRTDHGLWVCFRVANTLGVYGYAKHQIQLKTTTEASSQTSNPETPTPTASQSSGTTSLHREQETTTDGGLGDTPEAAADTPVYPGGGDLFASGQATSNWAGDRLAGSSLGSSACRWWPIGLLSGRCLYFTAADYLVLLGLPLGTSSLYLIRRSKRRQRWPLQSQRRIRWGK